MAGLGFGTPHRMGATSSGMMTTPSKAGNPQTPLGTPLSASRGSRSGRTVEKQKGLKLFSTKVCEKVRQKQTTSYNEVADELVAEVAQERQDLSGGEPVYDQKNIRRRVYDALNVLMAIQIIAKEKKEIRWIGLPTNSASECQQMEAEQRAIQERIARKKRELQELLLQQVAFASLVSRNQAQPQSEALAAPTSSVRLPFVLLKTNKSTLIECSISSDRTEYSFDFDQPFEIFSDADVLHLMHMSLGLADGTCTPEELERARQIVPRRFVEYIDDLYTNGRQPVAQGDRLSLPVTELGRVPVTMSLSQTYGSHSLGSLDRTFTPVAGSIPHQERQSPLGNGTESGSAHAAALGLPGVGIPIRENSQSSTMSGEESSPSVDDENDFESDGDGDADVDVTGTYEIVIKKEPS